MSRGIIFVGNCVLMLYCVVEISFLYTSYVCIFEWKSIIPVGVFGMTKLNINT